MKQKIFIYLGIIFLSVHFYTFGDDNSKVVSGNIIDVGAPSVKKIRIAITQFEISDESKKQKPLLSVTNRFKELMEFTNWFYLIPETSFPSNYIKNKTFNLADWKVINAEYILHGDFYPVSPNKYELRIELLNVLQKNVVAEKTYKNIDIYDADKLSKYGVSKQINIILRDFGDIAIKAITGKSGPFMSQIVFVGRKFRNAPASNIYVADFDGQNAYPITHGNTINLSPSWSFDGKKILYTSYRSKKAEIYEYNLDTKKTRQITFSEHSCSGAVWNPTGDLIAFASATDKGQTHLYTITQPGAPKEPLVTSSRIAVEPAFSPDGTKLAYTSNLYSKPMIFVLDFTTNVTTRLTYSGWYNASAAWNPDNEHIAFASFDKDINRWDLFSIRANGTELTRLTLKQGDNEKPSWSPDGRFIMFQSNRGINKEENSIRGSFYKIYIMSPDGDNQKVIHTLMPDVRQPAWGPRLPSL